MRFKIEYISTGKPCFLFARQLDGGDFAVSDSSTLGGMRIRSCVRQHGALTQDGLPDQVIFNFLLCTPSNWSLLEVSSIVDLQIAQQG
jgi:hypothetical protein